MLKLYSKESIDAVRTRIERGTTCKININSNGDISIDDVPSDPALQLCVKKETEKRIRALNIIKDFEEHMEDGTVKSFSFHYDSTCYGVSLSFTTNFENHKENELVKQEEDVPSKKTDSVDPISFLESLKEIFAEANPKTGLFLKLVGSGKNRKYQEQTIIQLIDMVEDHVRTVKERE